jgi:hypothetical protein
METRLHQQDLHQLFTQWVKNLTFYKEELAVFKNRLSEIAKANNKTEILSMVEHFQNAFIRQSELIDELKHDVNAEETALIQKIKEHPVASDHVLYEHPTVLTERNDTFDKLFKELKTEFEQFLSKTL